MATHSSILAWRTPWTEEPGGLQSMRSQRVRHDWSAWACTHVLNILSALPALPAWQFMRQGVLAPCKRKPQRKHSLVNLIKVMEGGRRLTSTSEGLDLPQHFTASLTKLLLFPFPGYSCCCFSFSVFTYLASSGLSCSTQNFRCIMRIFPCDARSSEKEVSIVVLRRLNCSKACGILVSWPGIEPESFALQGEFSTAGPPGKSSQSIASWTVYRQIKV